MNKLTAVADFVLVFIAGYFILTVVSQAGYTPLGTVAATVALAAFAVGCGYVAMRVISRVFFSPLPTQLAGGKPEFFVFCEPGGVHYASLAEAEANMHIIRISDGDRAGWVVDDVYDLVDLSEIDLTKIEWGDTSEQTKQAIIDILS